MFMVVPPFCNQIPTGSLDLVNSQQYIVVETMVQSMHTNMEHFCTTEMPTTRSQSFLWYWLTKTSLMFVHHLHICIL
jgi:hypothetical protein